MQIMGQKLENPDLAPQVAIGIQQALGGLGMVQMMGQQKKDENGRDYRGYTITLTPQGAVQMNGTDMSQMMGMIR